MFFQKIIAIAIMLLTILLADFAKDGTIALVLLPLAFLLFVSKRKWIEW